MNEVQKLIDKVYSLNQTKQCFLCFDDLTSENSSKEHIVAKWVFKRFKFLDEGLILGNNTKMKYRQLTIPACKNCNNSILNQIEDKFRVILDKNFKNLTKTEEIIIAQWTLKIMLGVILKETTLFNDRKEKETKILSNHYLKHLKNLFILLQTIKHKTTFVNNLPWSIFKLTFKNYAYNYISHSFYKTACFQLGNVGYAITFDDSQFYKSVLKNNLIEVSS